MLFTRVLGLIFMTLFSVSLFAQNLISDVVDPSQRNNDLLFYGAEYKGTPYLFESWQAVKIYTTINGTIESEEANFDVYSQKLAVRIDNKIIWVNDNQIKYFEFENGKRYVKRLEGSKFFFDEIVHEGRLTILKNYKKKFTRPNENVQHNYGGSVDDKPYFSKASSNYLVKFDDENFRKVALTKKSLEKVIPEKYNRVYKRLLKKEKVSFKREEELKSFLMLLETELKE